MSEAPPPPLKEVVHFAAVAAAVEASHADARCPPARRR
jgi:hypothetical protein